MGGNALKNTKTRRYNSEEYFPLVNTIVDKFQKTGRYSLTPIPAYRNKESFGDADILVLPAPGSDNSNIRSDIENIFSPNQIVKNDKSYSFNVDELQVDFILTTESSYSCNLIYYSWNDCSNLQGRPAHKMGFKYGHEGFQYIVRSENDHKSGVITLTKDLNSAMEFLGYDSKRHQNGFDSLEDIYQFASSTPYFHKDIFLLENRNYIARRRDKNRTTYMGFLKWLDSQTNLTEYTFKPKEYYRDMAFELWPGAKEEYLKILQDMQTVNEMKSRFNGNLVMRLTGLSGRDLGIFISELKASVDFDNVVLNGTDEEISWFIQQKFNKTL